MLVKIARCYNRGMDVFGIYVLIPFVLVGIVLAAIPAIVVGMFVGDKYNVGGKRRGNRLV